MNPFIENPENLSFLQASIFGLASFFMFPLLGYHFLVVLLSFLGAYFLFYFGCSFLELNNEKGVLLVLVSWVFNFLNLW